MNNPLKKNTPRVVRKASLRQQRAINLLVANGGNMARAIEHAGYSHSMARSPRKVFGALAVKSIIDEVVHDMESQRTEVLKQMKKKIAGANYATLSMALRNLNHDIFLLQGRSTERVDIPISEEEKTRLNKLIELNRRGNSP